VAVVAVEHLEGTEMQVVPDQVFQASLEQLSKDSQELLRSPVPPLPEPAVQVAVVLVVPVYPILVRVVPQADLDIHGH
jgi:hypothetical protein